MITRLLLATSLGALMSATLMANAQNPPGAREQDKGIREELGSPGVRTPEVPRDAKRSEKVVVPDSTVGQGQPGLRGEPEPPGGRFQDQGFKDEVGPSGGPRR